MPIGGYFCGLLISNAAVAIQTAAALKTIHTKRQEELIVQIKNGRETDYANFIAAQDINATGQATVRFIETCGGMMECVMEQGVTAVTEAAGLTVQAAADAAGIMRAEDVVAGATRMLGCWVYGNQLREWFVYHPPEILSEAPDAALNLFHASQELRGAILKLVDAYPCILKAAPNLMEVWQITAQTLPEAVSPVMPALSM